MIAGYLWEFFKSRPDEWEEIPADSVDDLYVGDIQIFKNNGKSHTNIYAGDGQFWDAGDMDADSGAFIGETKTSYEIGGYAYSASYRYRK